MTRKPRRTSATPGRRAVARWRGRCWAVITRRLSAMSRRPGGGQRAPALRRSRVTGDFVDLVAERVEQTGARVTARRLMRLVRAAGFEGSERSLRRAVASAKEAWRQKQALEGRVYRPWVSEPGEWLQFVVGRGSEGEGEQTSGRRQSCPSYRVPEGASPYWRSGFGEPIELVARESPRHQLLHVHRGSRCIRCLALASEHAGPPALGLHRDLGLRAPPTLRFESCSGRLPQPVRTAHRTTA
jgi:hypothetical protein